MGEMRGDGERGKGEMEWGDERRWGEREGCWERIEGREGEGMKEGRKIWTSVLSCAAKRTEKGPDVSGHIKVNISVSVEGESYTSFHQQYIKLHEVSYKFSQSSSSGILISFYEFLSKMEFFFVCLCSRGFPPSVTA